MVAARSAALLALFAALPAQGAVDPTWQRGEYLYRIAGCENCHTDRKQKAAALAGGRRFETPLGTFVTPNISADRKTGIGSWGEQDFARALRDGVSPRGEHYYPAFPYTSYTRLSDQDIRALYVYLQSRPAVRRSNASHELPWYLRWRPLPAIWKWLFFTPGAYAPQIGKDPVWNRGAYLVQAAAHCNECHTPRNLLGGFKSGFYLAGNPDGPDGAVVPNITPDKKTGIGRWSEGDLVQYLENGMTPDGDFAGDAMAELIRYGLKYLTHEDRTAIAKYVRALPPIEHAVGESEQENKKDDEF
jgi:mono/diheme cytochrome c family protein